MLDGQVFRINSPRVIFENIEGELILVNMEKSSYYSTDPVGGDIWSLIEAGQTAAEIRETIQSRYAGAPEEIARAVAEFLDQLMEEGLIVVDDEASVVRATPALAPLPHPHPFRAPVLNVYNDMRDMLLLDPVHDVEAAGWPVPKAAEASWPSPQRDA